MTHPVFAFVAEGGSFNPLDLDTWSNGFWTIVIFLAALGPMWIIVWGPMAKALEKRDQDAEAAVKAAEAARAAAEQARSDVERRLGDAQKESAKLIGEARAVGEAQGREALAAAQSQAQQTLERAKQEIEREKSKALSEIRETVVDLSLDAATKVVGRSLTDEDQRRFVRDFVAGAGGRS
ncbi:MAG TPA: F0F1 ATP synthase subunit B [Planctomycetota bacterium]|nr:F0F1 ATP synthase subunit B [Planctomycetota bacterium]